MALRTEATDEAAGAHWTVADLFGLAGRSQQVGYDGILQLLADLGRVKGLLQLGQLGFVIHIISPVTTAHPHHEVMYLYTLLPLSN